MPPMDDFRQLFVLVTGIVLSCFWLFGLYQGQKSILNVEEYRGLFKATLMSFLLTSTAVFLLREVEFSRTPDHWIYNLARYPYELLRLENSDNYSRVLYITLFFFIFLHAIILWHVGINSTRR